MIHSTCPCCEVACPPHRDGCTFHVDCQSEAKDFDDVALLRAEVARLRQERDALLESELWGVNCKPSEGPRDSA